MIKKSNLISVVLVAGLVALELCYWCGFRLNVTHSLPIGIYKYVGEKKPTQNARGATIGIKKDKLHGIEQKRLQYCHFLIKNILGLPGDTVELDQTTSNVKINGILVPNMVISKCDAQGNTIKMSMKYPCTIPEGFVFVGTNCKDGYDSRYFGLVPETEIIGKMRLVYAFK